MELRIGHHRVFYPPTPDGKDISPFTVAFQCQWQKNCSFYFASGNKFVCGSKSV